jgi:DNA mismatch repair ATPase MutL
MKTRFLISTAVGLVFATAAFAQSPSSTTTAPTPSQTQTPTTSAPATQKAPDTTTTQTPSASTTTAPSASTTSPRAQTTTPTSPTGTSQPTQAQTNTATPATGQPQQPPASSQAQQAPASGNANTAAQQPASQPSTATNSAQSSTNVNASVNINDQQRTRVAESITRLNVQPLTNVNFSLTVGTAVPRGIRLQTLPADVVEVVPQYRGYSFFVVRDEIVIVEPSTYQIVTVLPRNGGATAAAPAPSHSKVSFTDKDRDVVRKHVKTRTTERQTTGRTAKVVIRRGERLPESVEVEEFPETVYREAPSLREYRYIHRENRTYLVDPGERRVIEEID